MLDDLFAYLRTLPARENAYGRAYAAHSLDGRARPRPGALAAEARDRIEREVDRLCGKMGSRAWPGR